MLPGAAQGQQYATCPPPGPMHANTPMTMGQMIQTPQRPQYVQQPPSPGTMMTGAPRPPIGYQFGMNPNMSGQPPMATGGYPAGAAQGQQYATRPSPSPMQANPPVPMGQMMQTPQRAQYVQQPPRPGVMMPSTSVPRPPIGFDVNPNMSGQPPTATGGYPAGAAQIQQYYGMRPPPDHDPMQLASPPMRQAMQAPQWAPQYQPSRPGMMMPGALRPPERSGQPGGGGGGAGMIGTGGECVCVCARDGGREKE